MARFTQVLPAFFSLRFRAFRAAILNLHTPEDSVVRCHSRGSSQTTEPVKSSPESIARAKKWWTLDCAMCHGKDGDGKGETATEMKLKIVDFTDSAALKDRTDGEIFYIIKNVHDDMPPEGQRVKVEENWDLVNYVRSLAKKKADAAQKP